MTARDEVLARIRTAAGVTGAGVTGAGVTGAGRIPRSYRTGTELGTAALLDLLTERLRDYGCKVRRTTQDDVAAAIAAALSERAARLVVVPPDLEVPGLAVPGPAGPGAGSPDPAHRPDGRPGPRDGRPGLSGLPPGSEIIADADLSPASLDAFDAVVTGAALAIAETGTIILDGSAGQGRRALTLIPDYHLCLVQADQVVALVPEAIARLRPARPLTWISGPSATSDIELDRVEGVHGPRTLEVILIGPPGG